MEDVKLFLNGLQQVHYVNNQGESQRVHHHRASLMIFLVRTSDLNSFPAAHLFFRIIIPVLVFEFFILGAVPEHWLNHGSFLSDMYGYFLFH